MTTCSSAGQRICVHVGDTLEQTKVVVSSRTNKQRTLATTYLFPCICLGICLRKRGSALRVAWRVGGRVTLSSRGRMRVSEHVRGEVE